MKGCYEQGNELSGSIKYRELLDQLRFSIRTLLQGISFI